MSKNIEMQVKNASGYETIYPVPAGHKASHISGNDKITPSDIGAQGKIQITSTPDGNTNIWIDPDEDGEIYYTTGEVDALLAKKESIIKKTTVTLSTSWSGSSSPYTQTVTISGTTSNSKIDLQPDARVIQQMIDDEVVAMNIVNDNGVLTAYAIGGKPTASLTIQVTITEVSV